MFFLKNVSILLLWAGAYIFSNRGWGYYGIVMFVATVTSAVWFFYNGGLVGHQSDRDAHTQGYLTLLLCCGLLAAVFTYVLLEHEGKAGIVGGDPSLTEGWGVWMPHLPYIGMWIVMIALGKVFLWDIPQRDRAHRADIVTKDWTRDGRNPNFR